MNWMKTTFGAIKFGPEPTLHYNTRRDLLRDLAFALGNLDRSCGRMYSVAEHSVFVSRILERWGADKNTQLAGLLHDAHEAFTSDVPYPVSRSLSARWCFEMNETKEELDLAVSEALGCDPVLLLADWDLVHKADMEAFGHEYETFLKDPSTPFFEPEPKPEHPELAELMPWLPGEWESKVMGLLERDAEWWKVGVGV